MMESQGNEPDFAALTELDLGTDALIAVLSDSRRRFVLACLQKYATPMALADLADVLASWEHDAELNEIPADDVKTIYISLYHRHIPKLADVGLVEYSQERDAVTLTQESQELPLMESLLSQ